MARWFGCNALDRLSSGLLLERAQLYKPKEFEIPLVSQVSTFLCTDEKLTFNPNTLPRGGQHVHVWEIKMDVGLEIY